MEEIVNNTLLVVSTNANGARPKTNGFQIEVPSRSGVMNTFHDLGSTWQQPSPVMKTYANRKERTFVEDDPLNLCSPPRSKEYDSKSPPNKKKSSQVQHTGAKTLSKPRGRKLAAFPFDVSDGQKKSKTSPSRSPSKTPLRKPREFPGLSPLRGGDTDTGPTKVAVTSPLSPSSHYSLKKSKTAAHVNSNDDDELSLHTDDEIRPRVGPRPFPMSPRSVRRSPSMPSIPGPSKVDVKKTHKPSGKGKRKLAAFPMSTQMLKSITTVPSPERCPVRWDPDGDDNYNNDDSFMISPSTDPKTLCPYCDARLPSSPTPTFTSLLSNAIKHESSYLDPRPTNPLGRRAPLTVFISVCQRHRFESEILPVAEEKGWPKSIEWGELRGRVERMKEALHALIHDASSSRSANGPDEDGNGSLGPRSRSVFWREVIKEVEKKGSRVVAGVQGQFANFEKTQPGYYGELGSVIIHQTLYNLFPPSNIDATIISPLTPGDFIQRVLVPEVGVRLVMEDMDLVGEKGIAKAVKILRESANYGVAMFPEDGEWNNPGDAGDEGMGAADQIILERAMKRRQELEKEGETFSTGQAKKPRKVRSGQKENGRVSSDKSVTRVTEHPSAAEGDKPGSRPRPRPRPLSRTDNIADAVDEGPIRTHNGKEDKRDIAQDIRVDSDDDDQELFPRPTSKRTKPATRVRDHELDDDLKSDRSTGSVTRSTGSQSLRDCNGSADRDRGQTKTPDRRSIPYVLIGGDTTDDATTSESSVLGPALRKRRKGGKAEGTKKKKIATSESEDEVEFVEVRDCAGKDAEATPRPTRKTARNYPGTNVENGGEPSGHSIAVSKTCLPLALVMARQKTRKPSSVSGGDGWASRMSARIDTSEEDPPRGPPSSRPSARRNKDSWLLSDSSRDDLTP